MSFTLFYFCFCFLPTAEGISDSLVTKCSDMFTGLMLIASVCSLVLSRFRFRLGVGSGIGSDLFLFPLHTPDVAYIHRYETWFLMELSAASGRQTSHSLEGKIELSH